MPSSKPTKSRSRRVKVLKKASVVRQPRATATDVRAKPDKGAFGRGETLVLSERDAKMFVQALRRPSAPSARLKRAFKTARHRFTP